MPRQSVKEQLAALEKREQKLAAKRAELRAKERAEDRKNEARRHKLVGAAAIAEANRNPAFAKLLVPVIEEGMKSAPDRETLADLLTHWREAASEKGHKAA